MSTSPNHTRDAIALGATEDEQRGEFSRRKMLAGAMAATAVAAAAPINSSAYGASADPDSKPDMMAFLVLSEALTGIKIVNLAPEFASDKNNPGVLNADPGTDPINVKNDYFKWINASDPATFGKLLKIANEHSTSVDDIKRGVNANDDTKFLARSITLLWYLGSWYKPADLKSAPPTGKLLDSTVVSAKAYTQGRVWQIARAHPMGYSNLQFGYWSRDPADPKDPLTDPKDPNSLSFISSTIP
jgi:hypothetical protein